MFAGRGYTRRRARCLSRLLQNEAGAEQLEYVLIMAMVIVPLVIAIRLLWATLLFYFTVETLVVDLPFF